MNIEFDVNLRWQDVFRFNVYQTYTGMQGILGLLLPVIIFVLAGLSFGKNAYTSGTLYVLGGLVVLFYLPFTLFTRAKATMKKNKVLASTLHFTVTDKAIRVTQNEESGELPWDMIYKLVSAGPLILIYSSRINAYIVPREQIGQQYDRFYELAKENLPKYRFRLKK